VYGHLSFAKAKLPPIKKPLEQSRGFLSIIKSFKALYYAAFSSLILFKALPLWNQPIWAAL
jgi:hypothetical protein